MMQSTPAEIFVNMADPAVTSHIAENMKKLFKEIKEIVHQSAGAIDKSKETIEEIETTQYERGSKRKLSDSEKAAVASLYSKAADEAKAEEDSYRTVLAKIEEIRCLKEQAQLAVRKAGVKETVRRGNLMKSLIIGAETIPLYVSREPNTEPPELCGSIQANAAYVAKYGDKVAAFVRSTLTEYDWILADVISYDEVEGNYLVEDVDSEEAAKYTVHRERVIPLPTTRVNPETETIGLFEPGDLVLALYPQTTCFYDAVVVTVPKTAHEPYEVQFMDDSNEDYLPKMQVPQRYVLMKREVTLNESAQSNKSNKSSKSSKSSKSEQLQKSKQQTKVLKKESKKTKNGKKK